MLLCVYRLLVYAYRVDAIRCKYALLFAVTCQLLFISVLFNELDVLSPKRAMSNDNSVAYVNYLD